MLTSGRWGGRRRSGCARAESEGSPSGESKRRRSAAPRQVVAYNIINQKTSRRRCGISETVRLAHLKCHGRMPQLTQSLRTRLCLTRISRADLIAQRLARRPPGMVVGPRITSFTKYMRDVAWFIYVLALLVTLYDQHLTCMHFGRPRPFRNKYDYA